MKIADIILITLAGISLYLMSYEITEYLFSNANSWIPGVFSDALSWQPGSTFYLVAAAIISALFLSRFAPQPVLIATLIAWFVFTKNIYPMLETNGYQAVLNYLTSNLNIAMENLKPLVIIPLITYFASLMRRPNREKEVIEDVYT